MVSKMNTQTSAKEFTLESVPNYAMSQLHGLTAATIHTDGPLGFVDRCWLTLSRINMILILFSLVMVLLCYFVVLLSGNQDSVVTGTEGFMETTRRNIGKKLKELFYM